MPNPATPIYYYAGLSGLGSITCKLYAVDPIAAQAVADTITLTELTDAASNGMGVYAATSSAGLAGLYWAVLTGGMVDGGFVEMVASTAICVIQAGKFDWDTNDKATLAVSQTTAAAIRADLGLGSANLDTQLAAIGTHAANADTQTLAAAIYAAVQRTQATEAYAAKGSPPTGEQFMNMVISELQNIVNSGTTRHMKKLDGVTDWGTVTYDNSANPAQALRSS